MTGCRSSARCRKRPKQTVRDACSTWNKLADAVPNWPSGKLTVRNNRPVYKRSWADYPPSFQSDVEAFLARSSEDGPFEETEGQRCKPSTIKKRRERIAVLAAALVESGYDPARIRTLADLVTPAAAKAALKIIWIRIGRRKSGYLAQFQALLLVVARYWTKADPADIEALSGLRKSLSPGTKGMTQQNRQRLMQFVDPGNVRSILDLPQVLVDEVLAHDTGGKKEALVVQTAAANRDPSVIGTGARRMQERCAIRTEAQFRRMRSYLFRGIWLSYSDRTTAQV
jgi:hypothetical protein